MTGVVTKQVFFVSADWSKDHRKRSVHVADLENRRIWREEGRGWDLQALLKRAGELARRGSVLVGIDAVLGVPAGYWREVQETEYTRYKRGSSPPVGFIDWLRRVDPDSGFFEPVRDPANWRVDRPFFRVLEREGGLGAFTTRFEDGFRRSCRPDRADPDTQRDALFTAPCFAAASGGPSSGACRSRSAFARGTGATGIGRLYRPIGVSLPDTRLFEDLPPHPRRVGRTCRIASKTP